LIEIIVTLLLIAFVGLALVQLFGTAVTKSSIPLLWVRDQFILRDKVEQLTTDYVDYVNNHSEMTTTDFNTLITGSGYINKDYLTTSFINFTNCISNTCTEGSPGNTLKIIVTYGGMKEVVLFSDLKNAGDTLYIKY